MEIEQDVVPFVSHFSDLGIDYVLSYVECCGDSTVQSTNAETCDSTSGCSKKCTQCNSTNSGDCNCATKPCTSGSYGYCRYNGSCLYDQTYVTTALCGYPLPGYGQTASSTSSTTSSSGTDVPVPTGDTGSCYVQGGVYTCGSISTDIELTSEVSTTYNLTVAGTGSIKVNGSTKIHVGGCLILKNGSRLIVANNTFKNHLVLNLFDYRCLDGIFSDVVIYNTDSCNDKKLTPSNGAGPGILSLTFLNACTDSAMVTRTLTCLLVIIGGSFVVGGGLYYFVKNRKRQERKAQGLGVGKRS